MADDTMAEREGANSVEQLAEQDNEGRWPPLNQPLIFGKMIKVMQDVGAVRKEGNYSAGSTHYNFRGVDQVVNAVAPAFREHGILVVPTVLSVERETWERPMDNNRVGRTFRAVPRVRYTFYAEDGSSVSAVVEGESLDTSDKGTAKAFSVAYRIALLQALNLPTDDPDPDSERTEVVTEGGTAPPRTQTSGGSGSTRQTTSTAKPTEPQMKAMGALANEVIGKETKQIKAVMLAITGRVSSRAQMNRPEASKVIDTLKSVQKGDKKIVFGLGPENAVTAKIYGKDEEPFETPGLVGDPDDGGSGGYE